MPPPATASAPVERFRPTSGRLLGSASLVVVIGLLLLVGVTEPNLTGAQICLCLALGGVLIWMVLLRPRATAYDDRLVLHNQVSDWHLPLAGVEDVAVRHTLNVWVGDRRYTCSGIGRPSRQMIRGRGGTPSSIFARRDTRTGAGDAANIGQVDYASFVEARIDELARLARREREEAPAVRRKWALPELAAVGALSLALLVSLFV
jgi:hypothetical protein